MIQKSSQRVPMARARVSWLAVVLASSGCGVDVPLGELEPDPTLVDDEPTGVEPVYEDAVAPERLGAPDLTFEAPYSHSSDLTIGDMDGDGFDDMGVVVRDEATGTFFLHLRYGGPRPNGAREAFEFDQSGARLIVNDGGTKLISVSALHPAGDVDGDGYADLFVQTFSCENRGLEGNGGYLLYGGPERLEGVGDLRALASHLTPVAEPPPARQRCGSYSFAAPGDIDGDGFDDMMMTNPEGFSMDPGIYVIYGRAERFAAEASWSEAELHLTVADVPNARLSLFPGGDIDGDGRQEALVKYTDAQINGTVNEGRIIVVRGTTTRSTGTLNLLELEPQLMVPEARLTISPGPFAPIAAGDLDGDGKDDLIVQTPDADNLLFYGSAELLAGPLEASRAAATLPGVNLVAVGDRDGDGDDELMATRFVVAEAVFPFLPYVEATALETVSGTRARLSGVVTVLPAPTIDDTALFPDTYRDSISGFRYTWVVARGGDMDNDGTTEVATHSFLTSMDMPGQSMGQMHIHYGVHVPPASVEGPH
jgi:hypothetical protein